MNEDDQSSVQKFAIDVAHRLSSLRNFLEGSEDLCRYSEQLTDADVQRHARKLLAVMEVSRTTLNHAGVKLHLFTSCQPKFQLHKSAYFRMLVLIILQNQDRFPAELQDRVDRLLLPLSTKLFIWRNRDPFAQLGIADLMKNINSRSRPTTKPRLEQQSSASISLRVPPWPLTNVAASMPPPDAFPPKAREDKRRKKLLNLTRCSRPVHKQYPARQEPEKWPSQTDDEEMPAVVRLPTHVLRHFGIFCTANNRAGPSQQSHR